MYVCVCAAVTEARVYTCIDAGATTTEQIGQQCQAGTGCGSCLDRLQRMIEEGGLGDHCAA